MTDALKTEPFVLNIGPQHPATHGVLRLLTTLEGEVKLIDFGIATSVRQGPLTARGDVLGKLTYMVGKDPAHARDHDWFVATALAVRDYVTRHWMDATRRT